MNLPPCENPLLSDELLIVRYSGEIPEVALHGSLYYLTRDPEGPGIDLAFEERRLLKEMAAVRYREIIRRDLDPENRTKSHYRGPARCIANWRRMERFCRRERIGLAGFRQEVSRALVALLERELSDLVGGKGVSSINCTADELYRFCRELGLAAVALPAGLEKICPAVAG